MGQRQTARQTVHNNHTLEAEAGEATGECVRPLALLRLSRDMLGRLWAPDGGMAPEDGLKAGMQSEFARLEATDLLGEDMPPPRRAASNSACNKQTTSLSACLEQDKDCYLGQSSCVVIAAFAVCS